MSKKVIIGTICARGGSKGIPRKNLRMLGGKTLIARAIECARGARTLSRIIVSTDDREIAEEALRWGAEVPFLRPAELATDQASKWEVFQHLVRTLEAQEEVSVETVVDLDTGVPLRISADVETTVRALEDGNADVVVTAYNAERNPYFNMVEQGADGFMHVVKRAGVVACRQQAPTVYSLSPSVFAIRRNALDRYAHWSEARLAVSVIPRERAIDIDEPLDFQLVEFLMAQSAGAAR